LAFGFFGGLVRAEPFRVDVLCDATTYELAEVVGVERVDLHAVAVMEAPPVGRGFGGPGRERVFDDLSWCDRDPFEVDQEVERR
jgi:hypothetical protein